jgi:putative IMPACT (imprinted ancient) family translation regulator
MNELSVGKLIVKNSIFFSHLYSIETKDDINMIINKHKRLYKKANHHCFAIIFKDKSGNIYKSFKNDGEVGHPGKILLELLIKYDFQNNVIIVSRIFGGIKLGIGSVSRSFKNVGESVIQYYISKKIHN